MFVIAESSTTVVRLDHRFDAVQARAVEELLAMFRPVRHVVLDFANVREVDDAAVASLAETLGALRDSRVTFRGLSRHVRRVLQYLGIGGQATRDAAVGEPAFAPAVESG